MCSTESGGSMKVATPVLMVLLCALASLLALYRIHKLEPAMVFR